MGARAAGGIARCASDRVAERARAGVRREICLRAGPSVQSFLSPPSHSFRSQRREAEFPSAPEPIGRAPIGDGARSAGHRSPRKDVAISASCLCCVHLYIQWVIMAYEWDPAKSSANLIKHHIRFAEAVIAPEDEQAMTIREPYTGEEDRWVTLGLDAFGRILAD